jgi:hypothetical protein
MDIKRRLPPKVYDELVLRIAANQEGQEVAVTGDASEKVGRQMNSD